MQRMIDTELIEIVTSKKPYAHLSLIPSVIPSTGIGSHVLFL
jgi:hypothetical protein